MPDCFNLSDNKNADKRVSEATTNKIHNGFNNLFTGIGSFEGKFSLEVENGSYPYQSSPGRVVYMLQNQLKD